MKSLLADVRAFHEALAPELVAHKPRLQSYDRAKARHDWLVEEATELLEARTISAQADAYIDSIYFAIGGLVDLGIDPQPLWDIVQAANMAKVWSDGKVYRRPDGKVIKPTGWVDPGPLIEAEVARQIEVAE
jgi:predicted HAD superfamily Cof-like phosphohydrolase